MSSRKYNTNDNDLIWESFQKRTNHKTAKQNSEYDELLENDLKYIEEFLIREGIWDKVKGAAGAAAGKVKDFAADKIMKPLMDMLVAAIRKTQHLLRNYQNFNKLLKVEEILGQSYRQTVIRVS